MCLLGSALYSDESRNACCMTRKINQTLLHTKKFQICCNV